MPSVLASVTVKAATSQKGLTLNLFVPRNPPRVEDVVRVRLSVLLVTTFVVVLASFQAPAAWAYPRGDQEDPNEEESKHEINELQNRLHHTEDESKQNHLGGKLDELQQRNEGDGFGITTVWWTLFRYATATSFAPSSSKLSRLTYPSEECNRLRL